jgi:hypothetical protein
MSPTKRWKNGKGYELCTAFNRAIQKYGWANITHEILFEGLSKEEACKTEQKLIEQYQSADPEYGYNLTSGGEHYEPNKEWRDRLSESLKKSFAEHPEYREHLSRIQKGRKSSLESSEKKRAAMLKFYEEHPEKRKLCGNSFRGKSRGPEFSKKLGERKSKKVICVSTQKVYPSIKMASILENVSTTSINNVLRGRAKTCKGKIFAYATGGNDGKL